MSYFGSSSTATFLPVYLLTGCALAEQPGDLGSIQSTTNLRFFNQSGIKQIKYTYDLSAVTIPSGTLAADVATIRIQLPSTCTSLVPNHVDWDPSTGTTLSYTWTVSSPPVRTEAEHIAELEDNCKSGYSLMVTYKDGVADPKDVTAGNIPTTIEYTYAATERGEGGYHVVADPASERTHWYLGHYRCQQLKTQMCAFRSQTEWDTYSAMHTSKLNGNEFVFIAAYRWPEQEGMLWVDDVTWTHPDPENTAGRSEADFLLIGQAAFHTAAETTSGINKSAIDASGDARWFSTGSRKTNNNAALDVVSQLTNAYDNLEEWYPWRDPNDPNWNVNLEKPFSAQKQRPFTIRVKDAEDENDWKDWETDGEETRQAHYFCCRGDPVVVHQGTLHSPVVTAATSEPTTESTSRSSGGASGLSDWAIAGIVIAALVLLSLSCLLLFLAIRKNRKNKAAAGSSEDGAGHNNVENTSTDMVTLPPPEHCVPAEAEPAAADSDHECADL